jgi:hypothetical protein
MTELTVIDTNTMPWESGLDVVNAMVPAFRENLGPTDQVTEVYKRYRQKRLWSDPKTTRRIDLHELDAGYADVTDAFHDSVEECFVLDGDLVLSGEGPLAKDGYFWRPPGWIHGARTTGGVRSLLSLEGLSAGDASGPASRHIRPASDAGTNALHTDMDEAIGPRGWIRCIDTRLVAWQPAQAFERTDGGSLEGMDLARLWIKVLSRNSVTGAQTLLLKLGANYTESTGGSFVATHQFFVVDGSANLGDVTLGKGTFVHRPGGTRTGALSTSQSALLYLKSDGWLQRR